MPKSKGRKKGKNRPRIPEPPAPPSHPASRTYSRSRSLGIAIAKTVRHLWKLVVFLSVIVGTVAGLAYFLPRVKVDVGEQIDGSDPWSAPFTITNTNFVPLEHLGIFIGICKIRPSESILIQSATNVDNYSRSNNALANYPPWENHRLAMDERYTINLRDAVDRDSYPAATFSGADISVKVVFKPWFLQFHRRKDFRFVAAKQPSGQFRWLAQTIDNPS